MKHHMYYELKIGDLGSYPWPKGPMTMTGIKSFFGTDADLHLTIDTKIIKYYIKKNKLWHVERALTD